MAEEGFTVEEAREFLESEGIRIPADFTDQNIMDTYAHWAEYGYQVDTERGLSIALDVAASREGTGVDKLTVLFNRLPFARVYYGPSSHGLGLEQLAGKPLPGWDEDKDAPEWTEVTTDTGVSYKLPLRTLEEMLAKTDEPQWVWRPYIAAGSKTILSSRPKVGKSTTVFALCAALRRGESEFCGQPIGKDVGVIYLTEETSNQAIEAKVRSAGLDTADPGFIAFKRAEVSKTWPEIVTELHADARAFREHGEFADVLVVVDTLGKWAAFQDEKEQDSGATRKALEQLDGLVLDGFAILVVAHSPWTANRPRGSTAISGEVDVLLFLEGEPGESKTRTLVSGGSRIDPGDSPDRLNIAFDSGGHLASFGEGLKAKTAENIMEALDALKALGGSATTAEVADKVDKSVSTALRHLHQLATAGHVKYSEEFTAKGKIARWTLTGSTSWTEFYAGLTDPKT